MTNIEIELKILGKNGEGVFKYNACEWGYLSPALRVLAIHNQCRDITSGLPFDIAGRV